MTKTIVRISTDINKILTCPCARGVRVDAIKQDMGKEVEVFAQPSNQITVISYFGNQHQKPTLNSGQVLSIKLVFASMC